MLTVEKIAEKEIKKVLKCNALCIPRDRENNYVEVLKGLIGTPDELKNCSFETKYTDIYHTGYIEGEGDMYDIINKRTALEISKVTWTITKPVQSKLIEYSGNYNGKVTVMRNVLHLPMQPDDINKIKMCNRPVDYSKITMLTIFGESNEFKPKSALEILIRTGAGKKKTSYSKILLGEEINEAFENGNTLYKSMLDDINGAEDMHAGLTIDSNGIITKVANMWQ